jgi:hypothetical protein
LIISIKNLITEFENVEKIYFNLIMGVANFVKKFKYIPESKISSLNRRSPNIKYMDIYYNHYINLFFKTHDNDIVKKHKLDSLINHLKTCLIDKRCKTCYQIYCIRMYHGLMCRNNICNFPSCMYFKKLVNEYNYYHIIKNNDPKKFNPVHMFKIPIINKEKFISKYLIPNIDKLYKNNDNIFK